MAGAIMLTACTDRIQELENSCNANNGNDCLELAHIYELGKEVQQDNLKAMEFYKKTCNAGDVSICQLVAKTYFKGENGIEQNNAEGTLYSEKACDLGHAQSCFDVGQSYENGTTTKKDITKSLSYYEKACKLDDGLSCAALAKMYVTGENNVKQDLNKSAEYAHKGCELSNTAACYAEGLVYATQKENQKALKSFKKTCDLDLAEACDAFINMTHNSGTNIFTSLDVKNASEKLCNMDKGYGCKVLASYYMSDTDFNKRDPKEALRLYIKACDHKEVDACILSAKFYSNGVKDSGVSEDEEKAKIYYKKACDLGEQEGCLALSETGKWIEKIEKDEFTGTTTIAYFNNLSEQSNNIEKPVLLASCTDNQTLLFLLNPSSISCDKQQKIGLKFDDEPANYEHWLSIEACHIFAHPQPIKLLKKMNGKKKLMVRVSTIDQTFDLRGIDKVVEKLSNACHWKK